MPLAVEQPTTRPVVLEESSYTPLIGAVEAMEVPVLSKAGHKALEHAFLFDGLNKLRLKLSRSSLIHTKVTTDKVAEVTGAAKYIARLIALHARAEHAPSIPVQHDGARVLSTEYCYGYTDKFGKWNNGFPCPAQSSGEPVYCCGTATEPYCCRKKEDEPPAPAHDQTLLLGVALGTLLVVALLALGACLLCRRRMAHKNRHQTINGGPIYRMHCGSSSANTYSFSGHDSGATTPGTVPSGGGGGVTGGGGAPVASGNCHQHTASDRGALPEPFSEMEPPPPPPRDISSFSGLLTPCPAGGLHYNGPMPHMEPPPPYQVESPHSTLLVRTIPSDASNCSQQSFGTLRISQQRPAQRFQQLPRLQQQQAAAGRDPAYWCTKF